ncbi:hypothetical protein GQ54DRAFT_284658 [Martensiomyces pterosporus]|nr:hypothetical protein GQ54DRAFT_284658 [Martensiomyces pterosporus]
MGRGNLFDAEDGEITDRTDSQPSTTRGAGSHHFTPSALLSRTVAAKKAEAAKTRYSQSASRDSRHRRQHGEDTHSRHSRSRSRGRTDSQYRSYSGRSDNRQSYSTSSRRHSRSRSPARGRRNSNERSQSQQRRSGKPREAGAGDQATNCPNMVESETNTTLYYRERSRTGSPCPGGPTRQAWRVASSFGNWKRCDIECFVGWSGVCT